MGKKDKKTSKLIEVPNRGYVPSSHEHRRMVNELNDFIVALDQERDECDKLSCDKEYLTKDRDFYHQRSNEYMGKYEDQKAKAERLSFWVPALSIVTIVSLLLVIIVMTFYFVMMSGK